MICGGCGNQSAYRVRCRESGGESCNACGSFSATTIHDVYFREPYRDENLVDPKRIETKDGIWITSKTHKAQVMRELGVREVGDCVRGGRNFDPSLARRTKDK